MIHSIQCAENDVETDQRKLALHVVTASKRSNAISHQHRDDRNDYARFVDIPVVYHPPKAVSSERSYHLRRHQRRRFNARRRKNTIVNVSIGRVWRCFRINSNLVVPTIFLILSCSFRYAMVSCQIMNQTATNNNTDSLNGGKNNNSTSNGNTTNSSIVTLIPTQQPSQQPSISPVTSQPSKRPITRQPTISTRPSISTLPTTTTRFPSDAPSVFPTPHPTLVPTDYPSYVPSMEPTPNTTIEITQPHIAMILNGIDETITISNMTLTWQTITTQHVQRYWNDNLMFSPIFIGQSFTRLISETRIPWATVAQIQQQDNEQQDLYGHVPDVTINGNDDGGTATNNNDDESGNNNSSTISPIQPFLPGVRPRPIRLIYSQTIRYVWTDDADFTTKLADGSSVVDINQQIFNLPFSQDPFSYISLLATTINNTQPIFFSSLTVYNKPPTPSPISNPSALPPLEQKRDLIIGLIVALVVLVVGFAGGHIIYLIHFQHKKHRLSRRALMVSSTNGTDIPIGSSNGGGGYPNVVPPSSTDKTTPTTNYGNNTVTTNSNNNLNGSTDSEFMVMSPNSVTFQAASVVQPLVHNSDGGGDDDIIMESYDYGRSSSNKFGTDKFVEDPLLAGMSDISYQEFVTNQQQQQQREDSLDILEDGGRSRSSSYHARMMVPPPEANQQQPNYQDQYDNSSSASISTSLIVLPAPIITLIDDILPSHNDQQHRMVDNDPSNLLMVGGRIPGEISDLSMDQVIHSQQPSPLLQPIPPSEEFLYIGDNMGGFIDPLDLNTTAAISQYPLSFPSGPLTWSNMDETDFTNEAPHEILEFSEGRDLSFSRTSSVGVDGEDTNILPSTNHTTVLGTDFAQHVALDPDGNYVISPRGDYDSQHHHPYPIIHNQYSNEEPYDDSIIEESLIPIPNFQMEIQHLE